MSLIHQLAQRGAVWLLLFTLGAATILVLTAFGATASEPDCARLRELKRLTGTWVEVLYVLDGRRIMSEGRITITFQKDTISWRLPQSRWPTVISNLDEARNHFKLDVRRKPKTITEYVNGPPFKFIRTSSYRLQGDKLEICFGTEIDPVPKAVASKKGSGRVLIKLRRAQPGG